MSRGESNCDPGLMVRDALRKRSALTMRVGDRSAEKALVLRSPPEAGVSKGGRKHDARFVS
jgi:hypothetical protein